MGALGRDAILGASDLTRELVSVPEWGGEVYVRTMTGTERDAFETAIYNSTAKRVNTENIRARLAAATLCDDKGVLLFAPKDLAALGAKSAKALDRVYETAQRLNGMSAKDVEDLAKNSGGGQSAASGSTSPDTLDAVSGKPSAA